MRFVKSINKFDDILTCIEVGTDTLKGVMGGINDNQDIQLLAHASTPTKGSVLKGEVIHIRDFHQQLENILNELEQVSRYEATSVYLCCSGSHFEIDLKRFHQSISSVDKIVTEDDLVQVTKMAGETSLGADRTVVHTCQRMFWLDNKQNLQDPVGHHASQLTAEVLFVHADETRLSSMMETLYQSVHSPREEIIFSGLAGYFGLEPKPEYHQGALVLDIGEGTTNYCLYHEEGCMGLGQIALGIGHVVNDLSLAFGIPYDTAKEFFIQFSNMNFDADANSEFIQVPISKTQVIQVTKDSFATVIEARIREIIQCIRADVQGKGLLSLLGYGVVLTGGGAKLRGLTSIVQEIFSTRAFVGEVRNYEGNTEDMGTEWAVPIGALELGKSFYMIDHYQDSSKRQIRKELHSALGLLKRAIKL